MFKKSSPNGKVSFITSMLNTSLLFRPILSLCSLYVAYTLSMFIPTNQSNSFSHVSNFSDFIMGIDDRVISPMKKVIGN